MPYARAKSRKAIIVMLLNRVGGILSALARNSVGVLLVENKIIINMIKGAGCKTAKDRLEIMVMILFLLRGSSGLEYEPNRVRVKARRQQSHIHIMTQVMANHRPRERIAPHPKCSVYKMGVDRQPTRIPRVNHAAGLAKRP